MTRSADSEKRIKVQLIILSRLEHNRLIITGFCELSKLGKIDLRIVEDYRRGSKLPCEGLTEAIINDSIRITFDTMDGYNFDTKLMDKYLDGIDFCFKRSYSKELSVKLFPNNSNKVLPLSFNYDVSYQINKNANLKEAYRFLKKTIAYSLDKRRKKEPLYDNDFYENSPLFFYKKILFMCRLWNPTSEEVIANEKAQKEREAINKKRIELVRALKKKYGKMFIGGIKNDAYARNVCPDLVLDEKLTRKKRYLSIMKKCGICIATTGLHESTGWKFAEYVAAGKAIVSEPLHYEVFGEFIAGKNYLEFNSTEECINQIEILLSDSKLRHFIEKANRKYYKNYERPDKQIQNALLLAERMSNRTTNKSGKAKE